MGEHICWPHQVKLPPYDNPSNSDKCEEEERRIVTLGKQI